MKQGQASRDRHDVGRKTTPTTQAMSPAGVAQIGKAMGGMKHDDNITSQNSAVSMHAGRGFKGPEPSGKEVHKSGSQGKHR